MSTGAVTSSLATLPTFATSCFSHYLLYQDVLPILLSSTGALVETELSIRK